MRRNSSLLIVMMLGTLSGCGSKLPEPSAQGGAPHGGVSFVIPNQKGFVEIVTEQIKGAIRPNTHEISAYFYQTDATTPLSPPPTDVKIMLGSDVNVPLTLKEDGGKTGRFVSAPGPYNEAPRGMLNAKIGPDEVNVAFSLR